MTVSLLFFSSNATVLSRSSTFIFARQRSQSKYLLTTFMNPSPGFLFSPSVFRLVSVWLNPYYLSSMHFSIEALISKRWMDDLFEVHAIICRDGWNIIPVIVAFPEPLRNVYRVSPPSALKILITVPFWEAEAINVPSGFTLRAPNSDSCA